MSWGVGELITQMREALHEDSLFIIYDWLYLNKAYRNDVSYVHFQIICVKNGKRQVMKVTLKVRSDRIILNGVLIKGKYENMVLVLTIKVKMTS